MIASRQRSTRCAWRRAPIVMAALVFGAGAFAAVNARAAAADAPAKASDTRRLTLFYSAEVHGTVEPCGCTSDPLGDISRLSTLLAEARRAGNGRVGVGLVDAGGLLYPEGSISAKERPSADLRAQFLAREFERLGLLGAGLGETDLAGGTAHLAPKRLASNVVGAGSNMAAFVRPPSVQKIGDVAVGVLGIAEPSVAAALGGKAADMTLSARRDVEELRRGGAEVVVLLAPVDRNIARKLARDTGADVVVLGKRVGHGMPRVERLGRAFLVAPEDELQRIGRIDIVLRGAPPAPNTPAQPIELLDAGGAEANRLRREEIDRSLERLRVSLASWTKANAGVGGTGPTKGDPTKSDPTKGDPTKGDPTIGGNNNDTTGTDTTFVSAKKQELGDLEAERARLLVPWKPPVAGSYLVNSLVALRRSVKRDPAMATRMKELDKAIAAANLARATPPPAAEPGRASYVGMATCVSCHRSAVESWNRTVHAHAWKTLVDGGKQADLKCIGCHVTGFGQVGGSSLGFTKKLESVQCETCHGPGSLHVKGEGNEEPVAIKRAVPETVCLGCHTEQHSDTFAFEPYLRDIVGPGHGGKFRDKTLGAGKTGHELRSAALARAKKLAAATSSH